MQKVELIDDTVDSFNDWIYNTSFHTETIDSVMTWFCVEPDRDKVQNLKNILECTSLSLDFFLDLPTTNKIFQYMHRWLVEWYVTVNTFPKKTEIIRDEIIVLAISMYHVDANCLSAAAHNIDASDQDNFCRVLAAGMLNLKYKETMLFLKSFARCVCGLDLHEDGDHDPFADILAHTKTLKNLYVKEYGFSPARRDKDWYETIKSRLDKIKP